MTNETGRIWSERYREYLERSAGAPVGLDEASISAILDLARDVAHGTERLTAPLATFLAGQYVALRAAAGVPMASALDEAHAAARDLLPEPSGE
ncbi:MAG: DUF6457 domain-containing protein [Acidimicrobiales bacterium]